MERPRRMRFCCTISSPSSPFQKPDKHCVSCTLDRSLDIRRCSPHGYLFTLLIGKKTRKRVASSLDSSLRFSGLLSAHLRRILQEEAEVQALEVRITQVGMVWRLKKSVNVPSLIWSHKSLLRLCLARLRSTDTLRSYMCENWRICCTKRSSRSSSILCWDRSTTRCKRILRGIHSFMVYQRERFWKRFYWRY